MLTLKNISKSYQDNLEPTIKGIDLHLNEGEFCAIIGSNGSGKSTLLKLVSGEELPDKGTIALCEQNVTSLNAFARSKYISIVTQDIDKGLVPEMTLLENMVLCLKESAKFGFYFSRAPSEKIITFIQSIELGFEKYLHKPLRTLSGGQRQVIATMMSLLSHPKLLLLDEHTSALDPIVRRKLMDYTVSQTKKNNMTTLMITHDLEDAIQYSDRIIMLTQGKISKNVSIRNKTSIDKTLFLKNFYQPNSLVDEESIYA